MTIFEIGGVKQGRKNDKKPQGKVHQVKKDETLYSIAKQYGVSVEELRKYNKIGKDNLIDIGQSLKIPPQKSKSENVSIIPTNKNKTNSRYSLIPKDEGAATIKNKLTIPPKTHKVEKGESLYSLEKKYGLRSGELAYINKIDASKGLQIGQTLKIPERYDIGTPKTKEDVAELLNFSTQFIEDLMTFEGKKDVHKTFKDGIGNPTIGYGHLVYTKFERNYYKNRELSDVEIYSLLAQDLIKAENSIRISIGAENYENLSRKQKQALVDFVFSRGEGTFNGKHCKKLREGLIEGNFDKAATNLTYNRSIKTGKVMNGLTKRRLYEIAMFAGEHKSDAVINAARKLYQEGLQSAKSEKLNQGTIDAYKKDVQSWFDGKL